MKTPMSAWHATVRERCLSPPSWPLSEVSDTPAPSFRTPLLSRALSSRAWPLSSFPQTTAGGCDSGAAARPADCGQRQAASFYRRSSVRPSVIWPETGRASVLAKGYPLSQFAVITAISGPIEGVNRINPAALEAKLS